jgi:hypothetical protein
MHKQTGGPFTTGSVAGDFALQVESQQFDNFTGNPDVAIVGVFTAAGGDAAFTLDISDSSVGTDTVGETSNGTFTISPTGRGELAVDDSAIAFYLVSPDKVVLLGEELVEYGIAEMQTGVRE